MHVALNLSTASASYKALVGSTSQCIISISSNANMCWIPLSMEFWNESNMYTMYWLSGLLGKWRTAKEKWLLCERHLNNFDLHVT